MSVSVLDQPTDDDAASRAATIAASMLSSLWRQITRCPRDGTVRWPYPCLKQLLPVADPFSGTVTVSTDARWPEQYYKRLIAILHFLGDTAWYEGVPRSGRPAECYYVRILKIEGPPR